MAFLFELISNIFFEIFVHKYGNVKGTAFFLLLLIVGISIGIGIAYMLVKILS